jgi:hypothetical protein
VVNYGDGTVGVLLGQGDGTFGPQVAYAAGTNPTSLAVGDFNGDGVPDLAVANYAGVSVLLANGDGTFGPKADYAAAGNGQFPAVAVGDFNGDGLADLVRVNSDTDRGGVLLGNGDGTFRAGPAAAEAPAVGPAPVPARAVPPPPGAAADRFLAAATRAGRRLAWVLPRPVVGWKEDGWLGLLWPPEGASDPLP